MRRLTPIVLVGILAGCTPPAMTPEARDERCGPRPSESQAAAAVSGWVQSSGLKDPFSAQTRNINILSRGAIKNGLIHGGEWVYGWVIMFEVNAKNSYGAYVGFRTRYLVWNNGRYNWLNSVTHDDPPMPHFFR